MNSKLLIKTWKWCTASPKRKPNAKVAPEGFFPVYVGPDKQWFAVKTRYANHHLFMMLLEDAKIEYGYNTSGPIELPCQVDLFFKVVAEMEMEMEMEPQFGSCSPFTPSRRFFKTGADQMAKGYGGYGVLAPARSIKMK